MDADGDGVLTEAEIKALGQDRDGRSKSGADLTVAVAWTMSESDL